MHITYLSLFPELFDSFRQTTLVSRAVENNIIRFETINPRYFTYDRHRSVDDEIYGGGHGLLMKAQPIIDSIKHWIDKHQLSNSKTNGSQATFPRDSDPSPIATGKHGNDPDSDSKSHSFHIIMPHPSPLVFNQSHAHAWAGIDYVLFICGRYEGIDERVRQRLQKKYPDHSSRISLGQFITLGGELPAMTMTESIVRLLPGVLHDPESRKQESYSIEHKMQNIEHPQYTRPEVVEGMQVPDILLSGHHKKIEERKDEHSQQE